MNPEQSELLIRVDQNVINLVNTMNAHINEDKEFQKFIYTKVNALETINSERRGATKFAGLVYSIAGGLVALIGTFFFPHGVR